MPDFAKWFFVRYAQIYEAYVERTLIKFVYSWRKNSRKSGCKGDAESTLLNKVDNSTARKAFLLYRMRFPIKQKSA